ncbi:hypothetical protein A8L34_07500 [Bacillus sp. FJAT-27264]|uniref:hypothetical protein n=1 Tax=Paenibacillus sp. (strain DSM 101736 / FJAT-27264) TaxID=1850362 RepID=UPI000807B049|nr:hypothetical protein [Bacillus sp. FJAT-27264]OBZ19345.1 hypothetical protein A8L34_07500 [Bacillus sp. FJAT-27264]
MKKILSIFIVLTFIFSFQAGAFAANNNLYNSYDNTKKKELNTFFSNFSEVNMKSFNSKNYKDIDLIQFAILHNDINYGDRIQVEGGSYFTLKDTYVSETIKRFFGIQVKQQKINGYSYSNGKYKWAAASGAAYPNFSQVTSFVKNNDGTYSASLGVYQADSESMGNRVMYQPKNLWTKDFKAKLIGNASAIVKLVKINDKQTYQLLQYSYTEPLRGTLRYVDPNHTVNELEITIDSNNKVSGGITINSISDKVPYIELSGTIKNNVLECSYTDEYWKDVYKVKLTLTSNTATVKLETEQVSGWGANSGVYTFKRTK